MIQLDTEHWSLCLPEDWPAERDGESIIIEDPDGLGCLCISELEPTEGEADAGPAAVMASVGIAMDKAEACSCGDFQGWQLAFEEDGEWIREWYVGDAKRVLLISYSCEPENKHMDKELIEQILDTLCHRQAE